MSKKIIVALSLVAISYVGATWFFGVKTEESYSKTIEQVNEQLANLSLPQGAKITIVLDSYTRNFFSSDALLKVNIATQGTEIPAFEYKEHISHGPLPVAGIIHGEFLPVLARAQGELAEAPINQQWFAEVVKKGGSPLTSVTRIGFNAKGKSQVKVAILNTSAELVPVNLNINYDLTAHDLSMNGYLPQFHLEKNAMRQYEVDLTNAAWHLQLEGYGREAPKTTLAITFDQLVLDKKLKLNTFEFNASEQVKEGLSAVTVSHKIEKILLGESDLGTVYNSFKADNLNISAFVKIATDQAEQHDIAALLAPKPSFSIGPNVWENEKGRFALEAGANFILDEQATGDFITLLGKFTPKAHLKLSLSRDLVENFLKKQNEFHQYSAMVDMSFFDDYVAKLQEDELIVWDGKTVTVDFKLDNGQVTYNKETMGFEDFVVSLYTKLR